MLRPIPTLLTLATLSLAAMAQAQTTAGSVDARPAPIVRGSAAAPQPTEQIIRSQPIPGVLVLVPSGTVLTTVKADASGTELRLEHGRANVNVHHPASHSEILVDLPGGQTTLLKDGLYTFNADTGTVRVLKGEAEVYPSPDARPIKLKEDHELAFAAGTNLRSVEVDPQVLFSDVLQHPATPRGYGDGTPAYRPPYGYRYSPYGEGPYGPNPYFGYGYGYGFGYGFGFGSPYGFGYPYAFGYPFGLGYYGGFRGGYYGGFRGRGR